MILGIQEGPDPLTYPAVAMKEAPLQAGALAGGVTATSRKTEEVERTGGKKVNVGKESISVVPRKFPRGKKHGSLLKIC